MKRTSKLLLAIFFLITILAACKKNTTTVDGPFVVKLYNCNGDKNSKVPYVCFDSLITESRCGANALCIWSGYALIKVSFYENGQMHAFKMVTPLLHFYDAVNDTTINGYHLVLKSLTPYPGTINGPVSTNDIKATIEIKQ